MYILENKNIENFLKAVRYKKYNSSDQIFNLVKNKLKWLKVDYGQFLIFNQGLPHGNVVNEINETRWSLNCRFKSIFSPYGDKKIGEFFLPITTRAMTDSGMKYKHPFNSDET